MEADLEAAAVRFKEAQRACDIDPTEANRSEATRALNEWGAALVLLTKDSSTMQLHINTLMRKS